MIQWFLILRSTFFVGDRHPFPFFDSRFIIYSSWKIFSSSFLIWNSLIMVYDRNCFLSQGRFDPLSTSSTSILSMLLDSCLFDDKELTTSCSSFIPMQNDSENKQEEQINHPVLVSNRYSCFVLFCFVLLQKIDCSIIVWVFNIKNILMNLIMKKIIFLQYFISFNKKHLFLLLSFDTLEAGKA